jgi:hypothetical protein
MAIQTGIVWDGELGPAFPFADIGLVTLGALGTVIMLAGCLRLLGCCVRLLRGD